MGKTPCCSTVGMKKGFWTPEEDLRLIKCIQIHGEGNWQTIPLKAGLLRCGKACRLRWMNYLRPDIKRGHISADEEDLILRLHKLVGNRWSLIAGRIPGRTDNEIKNHWNSHLRKRFEANKIQPAHKQPSSQDNNDSPFTRTEEIARSLLGAEEVYNARAYASQDAVEPIQYFKQIGDGYDFSNAFMNSVGDAPLSYGDRPSSPLTFTSTTGTSAGYENMIEKTSNAENPPGSRSNLQLRSTMLRAECDIQIPSCRDEIEDAFTVDYDNAVEPMQNFKQISDGYHALTAINDFSTFFSSVGAAPWCYGDHPFSSMPIACNFPTPFISTMGTSAGYENITEEENNVKNLAGSESNMQLGSTLLEAECDIQIPSCGEEINDAFTVDYDNMVEAKSWKSTITAECWEPFSALCDEQNDCILSVEDYW